MSDNTPKQNISDSFTKATAVQAEGARVGFVSCLICGAVVMLDPRDQISTRSLHLKWHQEKEER